MPLGFLECRHGRTPKFCPKCQSIKELQQIPIAGPVLAALAESFYVIDNAEKIKRKILSMRKPKLEKGEVIVPTQNVPRFQHGGIVQGGRLPDDVKILLDPDELFFDLVECDPVKDLVELRNKIDQTGNNPASFSDSAYYKSLENDIIDAIRTKTPGV